ncbi:NADH dehydrogenase [ubiquinone] 1 alpha subcomplex subunit 13 [Phlebotomus argentipes]|uniref:NADH dehydrogenase [ubiquinone] 1 alpha subcomplex subunit 13 n=1 Tax=Phlebotomus argentipes TaxID=94469 RepID=UPI0028933163|nr:NADH dehydrogenase [ubiquinone] 1 alpha subcomplex subunit 13 [Phlebotomus argentipes]
MAARTQDLPPKGGYASIPYKRIPPKSYFKGPAIFAGFIGISTVSFYLYGLNYKRVEREEIEMRSARNAILPLLKAERDREYLKQLRRNRDEEAELMKNVKGWEVGTWYGEPVFKTLPKDALVEPMFKEFYVHAPEKAAAERAYVKLWN